MKRVLLIFIALCAYVFPSFAQSNACATPTAISSATTCITTSGTLAGSNYTAIAGACGASAGNRNDVWYVFTAQASSINITVAGALTAPRFQIYNKDCSNLASIFCSASGTGNVTGLTTGTSYLVRVYCNNNSNTTFTVCITHPEPLPARMGEVFKETILANNQVGINSAWELTHEAREDSLWITENRNYVIRKMHPSNGGTRVILNLSETGSFASFRRTFTSSQDPWPQGGMMGLAIHPKFLDPVTPKNFVYVAYVRAFIGPGPANGFRNRTATNPNNGEAVKGDLFTTFIVRFDYNTTTKALVNPVALCDTITGSNDHNSGRLMIAPVGGTDYLFYSCGDMGAGQFYSAERTYKTQATNSYEGKILRFNLESDGDAGLNAWIPNSNPYNNVAPVTGQSAVWCIGHRNVQGLANINGTLYGSSHGPFTDDEVNILESGKNYGHPLIVGAKSDGNYNNARAATANFPGWSNEFSGNPLLTSLPLINEGTTSLTNYKDPIYSFFSPPNGPASTAGTVLNIYNLGALGNDNSVWPSIAPSGMDAYTNTKIPGWKNSLLLASLKRGYLMRIKPNTAGTGVDPIGGSFDTAVVMNRQNRYRDIAFDPNGLSIYAAVDRSGSTSGPTATNPVSSACPGCIIKYTFLGYNPTGTTPFPSTIPTSIPIEAGTPNNCVAGNTVVINAANNNNNLWVPITGPDGNIIAEIDANNNNLGTVTTSFYTRTGNPVRQTSGGNKYLNRNINITVQTQPSTPVGLRLYVTEQELNDMIATAGSGVTGINDLGVGKNNNPCGSTFSGTAATQTVTGRYTQSTFGRALQMNVSSFSTFYFFSTSAVLPVEFITISAKAQNSASKIQWVVTNQDKIASYQVERSIDNRNFDVIGTVQAVQQSGQITYNFTDFNAAGVAKILYYRIRAIEETGSVKYTDVANVSFGSAFTNMVTAYPNPAGDQTILSVTATQDETAQIRVLDNTGRTVQQRSVNIIAGKNNFEINLKAFPAGLYYVDITANTFSEKIKLIKQ
jgi:PQQ-dependent dehydrogenase (s-GDH family)